MMGNILDFFGTQSQNNQGQNGYSNLGNYVMANNNVPNSLAQYPTAGAAYNYPFQASQGNYDFAQNTGFDGAGIMDMGAKGLNMLSALEGLYGNYKARGQAEDAFRFNRDTIQANFDNQVKSYNDQIRDRGYSRAAASKTGSLNGYDSVASYTSANSLNPDIAGSYKRNKQSQSYP